MSITCLPTHIDSKIAVLIGILLIYFTHKLNIKCSNYYYCRNHGIQSPFSSPAAESTIQQMYSHKSSSYPNMQKNSSAGAHRHSVGSIALTNIFQSAIPMQNMQLFGSDTQHNSNGHHVRFQDAEHESKNKKTLLKNVDIESSLESLCLQMMEHALGP